jgi:hypothetical protein
MMHFATSNQSFTIPTFGPIHITNFYLPKPLVNIFACNKMCIMLFVSFYFQKLNHFPCILKILAQEFDMLFFIFFLVRLQIHPLCLSRV